VKRFGVVMIVVIILVGCASQPPEETALDIDYIATQTVAARPATSEAPTQVQETSTATVLPTVPPTEVPAALTPTPTESQSVQGETPTGEPPDLPTQAPVEATLPTDGIGEEGTETLEAAETVLFEVDAGLTALQALDAVWPRVSELVDDDAVWILLTGGRDFGWSVSFHDVKAERIIAFNVGPDGNVTRSPDIPPGLVGESTAALAREHIVIDSDVAEQIASEAGLEVDPSGSAPVLFLRADAKGAPEWLVTSTQRAGAVTIDATTGTLKQP
jgi:hypothetical protein